MITVLKDATCFRVGEFIWEKKESNLLGSHCVSLPNDWDDVDLVVQLLHELNVKRLQTLRI